MYPGAQYDNKGLAKAFNLKRVMVNAFFKKKGGVVESLANSKARKERGDSIGDRGA